MKGKTLLILSCFLLTGCQAQVKQPVSAETKGSVQVEQEEPASAVSEESPVAHETESVSGTTSYSEFSESSEVTHTDVSSTAASSEALPVSEANSEEPSQEAEAIVAEETETSASSAPEVFQEAPVAPAPAKVEENYQFSVVKNQTTEEFIQTIGKDAQNIAWDEGLYASVMIAQAILETGSGNSQLARPPHHNLFGIKGSYQGKQVSFDTQEDKGNGQLYTIKSAFRQYPSYKESLEDYAALLKNGLSGNPGFYQATWKVNTATYQEASKSLTGKYATDTSYDKKLNALIETYELTAYDQEPKAEETAETSASSSEQRTSSSTKESNSYVKVSDEGNKQKTSVHETKQSITKLPPIAQRPAKQLSGNRSAE